MGKGIQDGVRRRVLGGIGSFWVFFVENGLRMPFSGVFRGLGWVFGKVCIPLRCFFIEGLVVKFGGFYF